MKCSRCGAEVVEGVSFCPKCGNYMKKDMLNNNFDNNFNMQHNEFSSSDVDSVNNMNFNQQFFSGEPTQQNNSFNTNNGYNNQKMDNFNNKKTKKKVNLDLIVCLVFLGIWIALISYVIKSLKVDYYFDGTNEQTTLVSDSKDNGTINDQNNETPNTKVDDGKTNTEFENYKGVSKSGYNGIRTSSDLTSIIYDNQYFKQAILSSKSDVLKLIAADSENQKGKCPQEVVNVEKEIVDNYGITAVNLCEMDVTFAKELKNVTSYIYNNFPNAHGYLTNLTLANVGTSATYMAAFMPLFTFATSKSSSGYPVGIKTQIILNTKYFLNPSKIKNSVDYGSKTGYFPKGATRSSAVAHEFGHYLSYVAMLNYYKTSDMTFVSAGKANLMYTVYDDFNSGDFSNRIIKEAYYNYTKAYGAGISYDNFRGSISSYALAKDENGKYIYDETIAEAFHDVYLNGSGATPASTYIMNALKKYL